MNDSSKTAPKRSSQTVAQDARAIAAKRTASQQADVAPKEDFAAFAKTNPCAQIMLNPALTPEAKRDALIQALTFSAESTREENRTKLESFERFKEYLQEQRKALNREGIKLQDTEAFAELQSVVNDMTQASVQFQDKIKPLLDVLAAVFEIRKQDKITDVYKEIQQDKAWREEQEQNLSKLEQELKACDTRIRDLELESAQCFEDKSLFGFGPVKGPARARIAEIQVEKVRWGSEISELVGRIEAHKAQMEAGPDSDNPDLARQKAILKEFLDLTKDENRDRQKELIDAAVNYVDTSDQRLKSVLQTLSRLGKHAEVMTDANGMLKSMHVIMDEGLKEANNRNGAMREQFSSVAGDESAIARMTREEKLSALNEHMTLTDEGAIDIANSIGGLTKHAVQIQSYKDTIRNESGSTKRLHLEGVSQMGEQLMAVISAISAAATSESRSLAANNFAKMAEQNQGVISQEVVRNATNIEVEANNIAKLVGELQDYGEVLDASSTIAEQGYGKMRDTVDALRKVSGSVQDAIRGLVSDRAEAGIAVGSSEASVKPVKEPAEEFVNPFSKLTS